MPQPRSKRNQAQELTLVIPEDVAWSLGVISRSLAVIALRFSRSRLKSDKARVQYLKRFGFDRNDIAAILGTTPGTVSVRLSEKSSPKRARRKKRGKD